MSDRAAVSVCVDRIVPAAPEQAFAGAVSIPPDTLIHPRGPMPGVAAWSGAGAWSAPGDQRTLQMTAGVTLSETLTAIAPPHRFAYRTTGFAGWFGALTAHCETAWEFKAAGDHRTAVNWHVAFYARGAAGAVLLPLIVKPLWPGFMAAALERLAAHVAVKG